MGIYIEYPVTFSSVIVSIELSVIGKRENMKLFPIAAYR